MFLAFLFSFTWSPPSLFFLFIKGLSQHLLLEFFWPLVLQSSVWRDVTNLYRASLVHFIHTRSPHYQKAAQPCMNCSFLARQALSLSSIKHQNPDAHPIVKQPASRVFKMDNSTYLPPRTTEHPERQQLHSIQHHIHFHSTLGKPQSPPSDPTISIHSGIPEGTNRLPSSEHGVIKCQRQHTAMYRALDSPVRARWIFYLSSFLRL